MTPSKNAPRRTGSSSFGFCGTAYNQVIVFQNKVDFEVVLKANPCMEAIIGANVEDATNFPGVYIAGIKANSQKDKSADHHSATQK